MRLEDETNPTSSNHQQILRILEFSLRLSAIPLTVASMWVMLKNNQANLAYGNLEFSNFTGFKYLVCINAISAGYSLAAAVLSYLRCFNSDWLFFILDQAVAYLMITSCSAVAEVLYLAHEGDSNVSWSEACDSYGKFCNRVKVSLALHLTGFVFYLALSLLSAFRLFSKFDPPPPPSVPCKEEAGEQGHPIN